jgi:CheY-like chemotaxis protein
MTAYAMKGDRERCLAAGMDAYISKPIQLDELLEVTESLSGFSTSTEVSVDSGWELEVALARVGGDQVLLADLAKIFCEQSPKLLVAVQNAVAQKNLVDLKCAAHCLRGAIATFAAKDASEAAAKLERFTRPEDFEQSPSAYQDLESKVGELRQALESFANGHTAAATPSAVQSC